MTIPTPQPGLATAGSPTLHPSETAGRPARPGWPEIGVLVVAYSALWLLAYVVLHAIPDEHAVASGLAGFALSALLGLSAFAAAWAIRIRNLQAFGVRRVRATWLLAGAGLGVVAVLLGNIVGFLFKALSGNTADVQTSYQAAAGGGPLFLVASLLLGSVATAVGEELAFRGC